MMKQNPDIAIAKYHSVFEPNFPSTLDEAIEAGKKFYKDYLICSKEGKINELCRDIEKKHFVTTREASKAGYPDCPNGDYWLTNSVEAMMLCVLYNKKLN